MTKINSVITAVHGYVPDYVLTNQELEAMVDTTDEWITTRTGIKERRILKGEGRGTSEMGAEAVKGLLKKRGMEPSEVDMLICCTVTPDMKFPATANIISDQVGILNAFSFDLNAACSGFIYGLITGSMYVRSGLYKKVVVVGADKMSSIVDYSDRQTCVIFGDGAGAVLLEPSEEDLGLRDHEFHTDGSGRIHLHMKAGGSVKPPSYETIDAREHFVYQEGQPVFKFAVTNMAEVSASVIRKNNLKGEDIAWLVPHQANMRIIEATARRSGIPMDRVMVNIQKYGNTTNATIPLCLWEWEHKMNKGDNIILTAFGGGFTWGAIWLKWAYNPS
ncbi:MAG: beta-ketoacyl-ACP synthase III [Bacteroidales bacterium]|jgi:3-oxoacyl-[acyl-carrier-protein] synthase-3|nr:beta-ketoacyl-ACP synthase III [Bacteroidales bacterium]NLM92825.1 ketoacyl-ACP synthase III [Bacteroidales bacterium]